MSEIAEIENKEWITSLKWIIENESEERVKEILAVLKQTAADHDISPEKKDIITPYINTITAGQEEAYPGDIDLEKRLISAIRWNAMMMVVKANKKNSGIGGHISTYSSEADLFEVALNHFIKGYGKGQPDLVFWQGHATPGLYSRSYVEHLLDEEALEHFREEITNKKGLSSYPHPRLMPDYWRFPTVSMGLAPIQAIYQARYLKYLKDRELIEENDTKVWVFLGDGEMDEPESTGAISLARREKLNNLIFIINCNLQRLDGPVRGNGKIINELEGLFAGAGWNIIKVLWGSEWDKLLASDQAEQLIEALGNTVDGQFQKISVADGTYIRKEFFEKNGLSSMVEDMSDEDLETLEWGGHDPLKIYNAYKKAVQHPDGPTVILAQTIKGYGQGKAGEASNVTHKRKKFSEDELKAFRDRFELEIDDKEIEKYPFYRFDKNSEEYKYLTEQRKKLEGTLPKRKVLAKKFKTPSGKIFSKFHEGSGDKEASTTGAFVQLLAGLLKDKNTKDITIPIIPDESRTFGLDSLFGSFGIYSSKGQQYDPVDKGNLLYYNEQKKGAIIEEGITEAGGMASFIAAGTNHISRDFYTVPFFVFYSMFGMQRAGDLIWAAADARAKGFLIGGISGRTTLAGEGLQHQDGYSHLNALAFPNLKAYDPAFAYELAVIVQDGFKKMYRQGEDIFYYITLNNDSYPMPKMPKGAEQGIIDGIYPLKRTNPKKNKTKKITLLGTGAVMKEVLAAATLLEEDYAIPVDIYSVTGYKQLYDNARDTERNNWLKAKDEKNIIEETFKDQGIYIAASDYVKALPLSIAKWMPDNFHVLGTDGFGRSDTVEGLRDFFEVDAKYIAWKALSLLADEGKFKEDDLKKFKNKFKIKKRKTNPATY